RGDPRGEFVRVQCQLAGLPEDDDRRGELETRQEQLFVRHGKGWAGPLRRLAKSWEFRRGFVEQATLRGDVFLSRGEELFRSAPIRRVRLLDAAPHLEALAACPHLERLTALDLQEHSLGATCTMREIWRQSEETGGYDYRGHGRRQGQARGAERL